MKCFEHPKQDAVGQCKSCAKGVCKSCAVEVKGQIYCKKCTAQGQTQVSVVEPKPKDPNIALILGLVLGLFGIAGIGQLYVSRIKRGLAFLLIYWFLLAINLVGAVFVIGVCLTVPLTLIFLIWQAYDAYKLAQQYNEEFKRTGKAPWS